MLRSQTPWHCFAVDNEKIICLTCVFHWAGMLTGENCDLFGLPGELNLLLRGYVSRSPDGFGGLVVSMLASGSRVRGFDPDRSRWIFSDAKKSSACLPSEGSKIICPMSQLWGMSKIPASAVYYGLLAKFSSVSFPR
jgi:hypothetical protein